jgi:phosphate-selective porin
MGKRDSVPIPESLRGMGRTPSIWKTGLVFREESMRLLTWPAAALAVLLAASQAPAQTGSLEDRVKALEMKQEEKGKSGGGGGDAVGAYFDDGLRFKSSNGSFEGRIGAYVITHYTTFVWANESDGYRDGFSIKEAGVELYGRLWGAWEVYIRPRIGPGGTDLYYGWVEFNKWDCFKVRAGLFKEPYSAERLEDVKWMDMCEDSLVSLTTPGRDLGVMIHGSPLDGVINYAVGVFNGNGVAGDDNSDKDIAARVALRPGAKMESDIIKHLTVGGSLTWGQANNTTTPFEFRAPATGTQFHFSPTPGTTWENNDRVQRVGADLNWIWGPLSIKSEMSCWKNRVEFADAKTTFRAKAWMAQVGFWLLGSTKLNNHRPDIKKPIFGDKGGFGDVQLVGRYSSIRLDDTYEEHAGLVGSRTVKEFALGVNYYPNAFVRISLMYVNYHYDHQQSRRFRTANGRVLDEDNCVVLRAQIDF